MGCPAGTPLGAGNEALLSNSLGGEYLAHYNSMASVAWEQHSLRMGDRRAGFSSHLHLCGPGWVREWPRASVSPLTSQQCTHPADSPGHKYYLTNSCS